MNLVAIALRIAAVEALRGNTLAKDNVLDSQIGAIEAPQDGGVAVNEEKRFISVYTKNSAIEGADNAARPFYEGGNIEMVFEVAVTQLMSGETDKTTGETELFEGIPATDASFEFYLDLAGRQIVDILNAPDNTWSSIWRDLAIGVVKIETKRADDTRHGRLAAHQIIMTCSTIGDPTKGGVLDSNGGFERFLVALESLPSEDRQAQAALLRATISGEPGDSWDVTRSRMGLSASEATAMGIGALPTDDGEVGVTETAAIDVEGREPVHVSEDS